MRIITSAVSTAGTDDHRTAVTVPDQSIQIDSPVSGRFNQMYSSADDILDGCINSIVCLLCGTGTAPPLDRYEIAVSAGVLPLLLQQHDISRRQV